MRSSAFALLTFIVVFPTTALVAPRAADALPLPVLAQVAGSPGDPEPAGDREPPPAAGAAAAPLDVENLFPEEREAYRALVLEKLRAVRQQVLGGIEDALTEKQADRLLRVAQVLLYGSLAGVLLLGLPLVLRKRYPGQGGVLFRYSALAAVTFFLTVNLFALVLLSLQFFQGVLGALTNPPSQMAASAFTAIENNLDRLLELAPTMIEPPLAQLAAGESESLPLALLGNAQALRADFDAFQGIASAFRGVSGLLGSLPILLVLAAVAIFLRNVRPVLLAIVRLPEQAASGRATAGQLLRQVGRTLLGEVTATLLLVLVLVLVSLVSAILMSMVMDSALEAFIVYTFLNLFYAVSEPGASTGLVYASLGGTLLFALLDAAVVLAGTIFYLSTSQRIFRQRFHQRVRLRRHGRFFGWRTLALLWTQVLPLLFVLATAELIPVLLEWAGEDPRWPVVLLSGPALIVFGFVLVFWAARGWKALSAIRTYPVEGVGAAAALAAADAGAAAADAGAAAALAAGEATA
jgi:hypothetical protein